MRRPGAEIPAPGGSRWSLRSPEEQRMLRGCCGLSRASSGSAEPGPREGSSDLRSGNLALRAGSLGRMDSELLGALARVKV